MSDHTSTSLIPHLCWRNASEAVEFYHSALGVETLGVFKSPDGRVVHAELKVDGVTFFRLRATPLPGSP